MSNIVKSHLAVFGSPIKHSLSPYIHEIFAKQFSLDISYERILVEKPFCECAQDFFDNGGFGCNITMPCKIDAYNLADSLSYSAKIAQAVNTLKRIEGDDGKYTLYGDNTDSYGFFNDLKRLNCNLNNSNLLILGSGGAFRGILPPLLTSDNKINSITVVSRNQEKVKNIIEELKAKAPELFVNDTPKIFTADYDSLSQHSNNNFEVLINTTSLSVNNQLPPIRDEIYKNASFVYDLFYTKTASTVFIEKAKNLGVVSCHDGLGMLVGQAALSFELWFNYKPNVDETIRKMRDILSSL